MGSILNGIAIFMTNKLGQGFAPKSLCATFGQTQAKCLLANHSHTHKHSLSSPLGVINYF